MDYLKKLCSKSHCGSDDCYTLQCLPHLLNASVNEDQVTCETPSLHSDICFPLFMFSVHDPKYIIQKYIMALIHNGNSTVVLKESVQISIAHEAMWMASHHYNQMPKKRKEKWFLKENM